MNWPCINIGLSIALAMFVAFFLAAYDNRVNLWERIGAGLVGASVLMTIGPIMSRAMMVMLSPFDDWSAPMMRAGLLVYFFGKVGRMEGWKWFVPPSHVERNEAQAEQAKRHLMARGKL